MFDIIQKFGRAKEFLHVDFGTTSWQTIAEEYYRLVQRILETPQEMCDKTASSPTLVWSVLLSRYNVMSANLKKIIQSAMVIPIGSAEGS